MTDYEDLAFDPAGIDEVEELKKKLDIAVKVLRLIDNDSKSYWQLMGYECFFDKTKDIVRQALAKIKGDK